jgi:sterol desaturase/sphingolipid hydroxylase (fatty acid hydroxylase superfamily)
MIELLFQPENILLLFIVIILIRTTLFFALEYFFTAHSFNRREVIVSDVVTMLVYLLIIYPSAQYVSNLVGVQGNMFNALAELPLALRFFLYLLVGDFLHYWIHRLMHMRALWRIHMWHHSPTHMSFMSGIRASFLDSTFVNLAFIFAWPILGIVNYELMIGILIFSLLLNDWMHLNIKLRLQFLEKIIITPRYHHIHHSVDVSHQNKNLAALFPLWDKLFGTYVDPDSVKGKLVFGVDTKVPQARLAVGV